MRLAASIAGPMLFVLFGPLIWGGHMLVVYGGHASLCEAGDRLPLLDAAALPWLMMAATIAALTAVAASLVWPAPLRQFLLSSASEGQQQFLTRAMRFLGLLSLFGVTWAGLAIAILPSCLQLH
jgi:hypothetical protein